MLRLKGIGKQPQITFMYNFINNIQNKFGSNSTDKQHYQRPRLFLSFQAFIVLCVGFVLMGASLLVTMQL